MRSLFFIVCFIAFSSLIKAQLVTVNNVTYAIDTYNQYASVGNGTPASYSLAGEFTIPSSVTYNGVMYPVAMIQTSAFSDLSGLTGILIPTTVKYVGMDAFKRCYGLTNVNIPASVQYIYDEAFTECTNLTSISIPTSVTYIGNSVFNNCAKLSSITIPSSVTHIGNYAFYACNNLTSIHVTSTVPVDLSTSTSVFSGVSKTKCTLYVPQGSKSAYQASVQWKDFLNIVEESITTDVPQIQEKEIIPIYNSVTHQVYFNGLKGKVLFELYNSHGFKVVDRYISDNELISLDSFKSGVYVFCLRCNGGKSYVYKISHHKF